MKKKFILLTLAFIATLSVYAETKTETYTLRTWLPSKTDTLNNYTSALSVEKVTCTSGSDVYLQTATADGHSLNSRFAFSTNLGSSQGISVNKNQIFSILDLKAGDKVKIVPASTTTKFLTSNATYDNAGTPTSIVASTTLVDTVTYTMTEDGTLDFKNTSSKNLFRINTITIETSGRSQMTIALPTGKDTISFSNGIYALNFSDVDGLDAYVASAYSNNNVSMTKVGKVPASTGLILQGTGGTNYTIPVLASADAIGTNLLTATTNTEVSTSDGSGNYTYILSAGSFYALEANYRMPEGKAYLSIARDPSTAGGKVELDFGESPTGINDVEQLKNYTQSGMYNLQGILVDEKYKGIVIRNGKKYLNK